MLLYAPKFKNNGSTVGKSGAPDDDDNNKASNDGINLSKAVWRYC